MREYLVICGVAAETNDSALIPRCFEYHSVVSRIDLTVRTRWSSDLIEAECVDAILEK